jgi:hypothetical protein
VQSLHYYFLMPIIIRFLNCAIYVNAREHNPPHFHIHMKDGREVWVDIETLKILSGSVPKREIIEALDWAKYNFVSFYWQKSRSTTHETRTFQNKCRSGS